MSLARRALISGIAGLPLLLVSYAWIPFALVGREAELVRYAVVVAEIGALAAGSSAIALGIRARRRSAPGHPDYSVATRGLVLGAVVLVLVVVPNVVGAFVTAS